mgnify:CR=1 FL=1|jgi:NAD(P)-dependent dehydrogenase (short-subunit alcohol dehydrogenase family)
MPNGSQAWRRVLITGAAGETGRATARAFVDAGDRLILTDRDAAAALQLAQALGPHHSSITLPTDGEGLTAETICQCIADHGPIDVLVFCHDLSVPDHHGSFTKPLSEFRALTTSRLDSRFVIAREVGRAMLSQGSDSIIHVLAHPALADSAADRTAAAAVLGFMRAQACEWALGGVRVNALITGTVGGEQAGSCWIPLGRAARAAEVASAVLHLAAASYTTGATIHVDGGLDAYGDCALGTECAPAFDLPQVHSPVALVTGGASGIGAAIAKRLIAQGARVAIFDRDLDSIETRSADILAIAGDVLDEQAVKAAVGTIERELGPINWLANNAGIADVWSPTVDQNLADFRHVHEVNMLGAFTVARTVAARMAANGTGGSIVNLSSVVATGGMPRRNAYCGAKAGISMMTKALACEWAPLGIRVNAVAPGTIAMPGVQALEQGGRANFREMRRRVPMGRFGMPAEIADVAGFLLSDASSYMTGTIYVADGGYSVFGAAGPAAEVD